MINQVLLRSGLNRAISLFSAMTLLLSAPVYADSLNQSPDKPSFEPNTLLLVSKASVRHSQIRQSLIAAHCSIISAWKLGGESFLRVRTEKGYLEQAESYLACDKNFKAVQRNWYCVRAGSPNSTIQIAESGSNAKAQYNDPYFGQQWYLAKVSITKAMQALHEYMQRARIGLIDNGCANIKDLQGQLDTQSRCAIKTGGFIDGGSSAGHGTEMATVLAACANNQIGTVGANPYAYISSYKLKNFLRPSDADLVNILFRVSRFEPSVRIMVLGCCPANSRETFLQHEVVAEAFTLYCRQANAVIFAPAGNDSASIPGQMDSRLVLVAASNEADQLCQFTNYGAPVWFAAPGKDIYCSDNSGKIVSASGTCFSAAIAAAIASMVVGINPKLSNTEVINILARSASTHEIGAGKVGYGMIDADKACRAAIGTRSSGGE